MLAVNHITKKYGKFTALKDICIEFENGVYGLLAPNGAGKTTFIKMITTLSFPDEGEILWDGKNIMSLGEKYREIIGYLPQDFGYYKNYSPCQYLRYISALKGISKKDADRKIDELLNMVKLVEYKDKKLKTFSGGMIQRVGIAQAILNDPLVLVMDEPTAGLDPKERVRFRNIIHELSHNRIVILSTHIVSDIETIANKVVMFKDHKLYKCESPSEICNALKRKIYEAPIEKEIHEEHFILGEKQYKSGTVKRFVCEEDIKGVTSVSPNLEDVFLYIYRDTYDE